MLVIVFLVCLIFFIPYKVSAEETLLIHCGAGLSPAMDEIKQIFEKNYNCIVDYSYKGSGCLLADINFSHKGDLYLPGEDFYLEKAIERGYILESKKIAYWTMVIVTPRGNPKNINNLQDLTKQGVRVGIGDEKAAAIGKKTFELLKKAGIYEQIKKNQVMASLNVNELSLAAKLGHIDAGIAWTSSVMPVIDSVEVILLPREITTVTTIPIGVLKFTKNKDLSKKFVNFLSTETAKKIFQKHGYSTSKEDIETDLLKIIEQSQR
ncbi:MAG: molybdate ABC transporter substrate-binding protein [Vulcanimicrobiota bacterium]